MPVAVVIGRRLLEALPAPYGSELLGQYAHAIETAQPIVLDAYRYPDASRAGDRNFDIRIAPVGDILYCFFRDATSRVKGLRDLAASEARYRLLAENATDIVAQADMNGILQWVSPSVTQVLGWTPDALVGHPIFEFLHPDDLPAIKQAQPQIAHGGVINFEARMRTADGGYRWIASHVRPLVDESGECIGRVAGWRDVQEQHEAVEALQQSEERFRLLAGHATDVVYAAGLDRRVTWVSPTVTHTLGWSPEELVGTVMADLLHPDDRAATEPDRSSVYAGKEVAIPVGGYVVRFLSKSGEYHWMANRITILSDPEGRRSGIVGSMTLVDDLVEARQRAEADEALLRAIADASFDPQMVLEPVRDSAGRIVDFTHLDVNPAACAYLSRRREDLVGKLLLDVMPGLQESGQFDGYVRAIDADEPFSLDEGRLTNSLLDAVRFYDVRARRVPGSDHLSLTWRDVTERYEAEQRLADSELRYRLIAENSSDVVLLARAGIMQWVSPSLTKALGWATKDWESHAFEEFCHPDDIALLQQRRAEVSGGATTLTNLRARGTDGAYHWVEIHAGPFTQSDGTIDGILASFRIIDQEVATQQELQRRAAFDDLTGVLKREGAVDRLAALGHRQRVPGDECGVLFIDIDAFKAVNDDFGHAAGDAWLRALSQRIGNTVRSGDTVARMGGDEFLVILDAIHNVEEAEAVAEKIRLAAARPVHTHGEELIATVSIGVTVSNPGESADSIISRADAAMYEAKRHGRNQVVSIPADGKRH